MPVHVGYTTLRPMLAHNGKVVHAAERASYYETYYPICTNDHMNGNSVEGPITCKRCRALLEKWHKGCAELLEE